jgi:hypothetical protein
MTREEYTALCAALITAIGDDSGTYVVTDPIGSSGGARYPAAFVLEAMTFHKNRDMEMNEDLVKLVSDYFDYYSIIDSIEGANALDELIYNTALRMMDVLYSDLSHEKRLGLIANEDMSGVAVGSIFTELLCDGQLLFYTPFYSELRELDGKENVDLYTYPASRNSNFFYNMEGLSIVKNSRSEQAWDFIKFMLGYEVQRMAAEESCPVHNNARAGAISQTFADGTSVLSYVNELTSLSVYKRPAQNPLFNLFIKRDYANGIARYMVELLGAPGYGGLTVEDYALMMGKEVREDFYPKSQFRPVAWYWQIPLYILTAGAVAALALLIFIAARCRKRGNFETSRNIVAVKSCVNIKYSDTVKLCMY